jgi:outer membrane protein assembly factor BamB
MKHLLSTVALFSLATFCHAADWPCWRGPQGNGISDEPSAPLKWSPSRNIAWRTEIPGKGRSSPIVSGDRIFLTTGVDEDQSRRILCLDRHDGQILWNAQVHSGPGGKMHQDNTMASSTPATDGERVFAVFVDDQGMKVVAVDFDGAVLWSNTPGTYFSDHGLAASPVLYGPGVIVNGHQDGTAFVVMLDRATGKEIWRYTPAISVRSRLPC